MDHERQMALEALYRVRRQLEDEIDALMLNGAIGWMPPPVPVTAGRLGIIVGHTARAPGAFGVEPIGTNEYHWNKQLAKAAAEEAGRLGLSAEVFYRDVGGVAAAYRRAAEWGAQAILELHFNAFPDPAAHGSEVVYDAAHDKPLAAAVQREVLAALGLRDRGIKTQPRGSANDDAAQHIPSVIVEPFFGSNARDAQRAHERKAELAGGYARAAAAFLKGA